MCVHLFSSVLPDGTSHKKILFPFSPSQPCVCCVCRRILNYSQVELELPCLKRFMLCVCVSSHFKWTTTTMRKFSSLVTPKHRFAAELCYVFQQEWDFSLQKKRHRRYSTATTWKWSTHCKDTWSISKTLLEFWERKKNIVVGTNEQAATNDRRRKSWKFVCLKLQRSVRGRKRRLLARISIHKKKTNVVSSHNLESCHKSWVCLWEMFWNFPLHFLLLLSFLCFFLSLPA